MIKDVALTDGDREDIIRTAIKQAAEKNITLTIQSWGIEWNKTKERWLPKKEQKCCALACVILERQDTLNRKTDWRSFTIETLLECDTEWIRSFQRGFDGYPKTDSDENFFAYDLGFLLKDELVKDVQLKMPNL